MVALIGLDDGGDTCLVHEVEDSGGEGGIKVSLPDEAIFAATGSRALVLGVEAGDGRELSLAGVHILGIATKGTLDSVKLRQRYLRL